MGRCRNHFPNTYAQNLILSAPPLIFALGLVGALRAKGSDTIVARESFIFPAPYQYEMVFEKLDCLISNILSVVMGWHKLVFHTFLFKLIF